MEGGHRGAGTCGEQVLRIARLWHSSSAGPIWVVLVRTHHDTYA
jgi:hypothetical protein